MSKFRYTATVALSAVMSYGLAAPAVAQEAGADASAGQIDDIIVTAQKREQRLNEVPMSIAAVSGAQLQAQGVTQTADLVKVIPGFNYTVSGYQTPVYFIRGVGYFESSLAADPAVSVYVDEVSLPFSTMTMGAGLDLERVEVLKGPQGILFGRNSTGGAINYIAAKPTDDFRAGFDASYQRFGQVELGGFVSGPISDTLTARLSARTQQGGAWQRSYTRDDENGAKNMLIGRLLLDWRATDRLFVEFNFNGWVDRSENLAPQLAAIIPKNPAALAANHPLTLSYPLAPLNARAVDFNPGRSLRNDNNFKQVSAKIVYDVTDDIVLTSLTSYAVFNRDASLDQDGMIYQDVDSIDTGQIRAFSQEVRLSGKTDSLSWLLGGSYQADNTKQYLITFLGDSSTNPVAGQPVNAHGAQNKQNLRTYGAFAHAEYEISPNLAIQAGVRYTQANRSFNGCGRDTGDGVLANAYEALQRALRGGVFNDILPGGCTTLDTSGVPNRLIDTFNQNNISWRVGASWKSDSGTLLYATANQGYKAGGFLTTTAGSLNQFRPITQEKVIAYELGFKAPLFGRRVQLNGAVFYNDYTNKQVRGIIPDPVFRSLQALVNIPKSRIGGAEFQLETKPFDGLTMSWSGVYLDTKVTRDYIGLSVFAVSTNYRGSKLPYTPKYQSSFNAQYTWPISEGIDATLGGHVQYHSRTNAQLGTLSVLTIRPYTTIDLNADLSASDDSWRVSVFGRNITNKYYWNAVNNISDVVVRYAAMPVTYGVRVSHRF